MSMVYISKPGLICAAGNSAEELWASVTSGNQKGIKKVSTRFAPKEFFAGRADYSVLKESGGRFDMTIFRMEDYSLEQIKDYIDKAVKKYGSGRVGVCAGSCDNGSEFSIKGHEQFFKAGAFAPDYEIEMQSAHYAGTFIKEKFNLEGPCLTFATACSSSAAAIIKAAQLIKSGICDAVVAGGADMASDTVLLGFDSLEAVSPEISNPFSKNRTGITLGEASAFFVLSRDYLDDEKIILAGYGETSDAYHMTSPDPSGEGAACAMSRALESAGIRPEEIDYLNLHGTGTHFNDSMEAAAVNKVFGNYRILCSSTKPLTGHTLGAAAAVELAICYEAIINSSNEGNSLMPLQVWDGEKDEELPELNFCDEKNPVLKNRTAGCCMSNSFAFGGCNASLIIKRVG